MAVFTTWAAIRTAVLDAIATYVAGAPITGEYTIGGRTMKYRSIKELRELYEITFDLEAIDNSGTPSSTVSYGQYSRG